MGDHHKKSLDINDVTIPEGHAFHKLWVICGVIGAAALAVTFAIGMGHKAQLAYSYLVAFAFTISIALGGLFFVLFNFASKAGWSVAVRRVAENIMATLPLFFLLLLPLLALMGVEHGPYEHWLHPHDALIKAKTAWLNKGFFIGRSIFYIGVWSLMGVWFFKTSVAQDQTGDPATTRRLQARSYPGILVFALTVSFAAFDWLMSVDPHWYSTIWGVYYFAGCLIAIFATMIVVSVVLQSMGLCKTTITPDHFHDLGKFLFAFSVFWAYIAFSQFMLQWYGNIPEETIFYAKRWFVVSKTSSVWPVSNWRYVTVFLALGHFVVPFFFLMPRTIKRKPMLLLVGALWMLFMHFVDTYWLVMPNLHAGAVKFSLLDVTALVGVLFIFLGGMFFVARRQALVPTKDPRLGESLRFENFTM